MTEIFGVQIADISKPAVLDLIRQAVNKREILHIVTANPEILLQVRQDSKYGDMVRKADIVVADGIGIKYAALISGYTFVNKRVTGVELTEEVIKLCDYLKLRLLVIGARNLSTIQKATHNVLNKISENIFAYSNQNISLSEENIDDINRVIIEIKPDIILVSLGHYKQELLINTLKAKKIPVVYIGVGGSFDYLSDNIARPGWAFRSLGLEWVIRLWKQPRIRLRRVIRAVVVFPMVLLFDFIIQVFHVEQSGIDKTK